MKKIIILVMALGMVFDQIAFSADNTSRPIAIEKPSLDNTNWTVSVKPSSGKGKAETDMISFIEGKMISKNMKNAGFNDAEVNVKVDESGVLIWETMQADGKGGFAFWRGSVENGKMKGRFTKEDKRGAILNFSFASE
ncbi:MAG: hypothetical protein KKB22_03980 [Candidatus Omnitrophica bacterium]|nr:hypothetical protein [Candidatus Omnitrophota bacterium]